MTDQEIFDAVARHLFAQGKQSVAADAARGGTICMYRTPDGCRCAVGALLTDDEYDLAMEGQSVAELAKAGLLPGRLAGDVPMLEELQRAHDRADRPERFKRDVARALRDVASEYDVSIALLEQLEQEAA